MVAAQHLDALEQIVGAANLICGGADAEPYETGARYDRGKAAFVVRPGATREVSQIVAYCALNNIHLIPQSGNTGLVQGSTPDGSGMQGVLAFDRLRSIDVDPINRIVTAGAGVRLSALNDVLAQFGLMFPIDLGADPMVGGMVATNTGGARFIRYGDVRRNVLGLEVVRSNHNGEILTLGSGLRKNNTGLDIKHLFIGSCGAIGFVTRAVLELHRVPAQVATALLVPRNDDAILELLTFFEEQAGAYLAAFEGMSGAALDAVTAHVPSIRNPFKRAMPAYAILVELTRSWSAREGEMSLGQVLEAILMQAWDLPSAPLIDALIGDGENLWRLRHAIPEGIRSAGRVVAFDLSLNRADLPRFRASMLALLRERFPSVRLCDFGHIGDGGMHFNVVIPPGGQTDPEFIADLRDFVIGTLVEDYGGSFSAEHGLGRSNQAYYDRYRSEPLRALSGQVAAVVADIPVGTVRIGLDR